MFSPTEKAVISHRFAGSASVFRIFEYAISLPFQGV